MEECIFDYVALHFECRFNKDSPPPELLFFRFYRAAKGRFAIQWTISDDILFAPECLQISTPFLFALIVYFSAARS